MTGIAIQLPIIVVMKETIHLNVNRTITDYNSNNFILLF
jgi:hypothetical protein